MEDFQELDSYDLYYPTNKKTYNLRQESFLNELRILVSKKQLVELTVNEGWYSESEMRDELHWHKFGPQLSSF